MTEQTHRRIRVENSTDFNHIKWIELHPKDRPGMMTECAVLKEDQFGNLFFFEVSKLDNIDRQRLFKLITNRHAKSLELWDLMSNHTLGNGMNALAYFHQLVNVITPEGVITNPRAGVIGASAGTVQVDAPAAPAGDAE